MANRLKKHTRNFTTHSNDIYQHSLSLEAIGLYCYLIHLPSEWIVHKSEIETHIKNGKYALNSAWKELEHAGFIKGVRSKNSLGKFDGFDWEIFDELPQSLYSSVSIHVTKKPHMDKPEIGKPDTIKDLYNKRLIDDDINKASLEILKKYRNVFGNKNTVQLESLTNQYGSELVKEALDRTSIKDGGVGLIRQPAVYIAKMLLDWKKSGARNLEDVNRIDPFIFEQESTPKTYSGEVFSIPVEGF
ncbi:MAG: hypothetical protein LBV19_08965 [Streptococcaceae bacterium]|jgi:DNA replication protein DnaD|nr:hypothetical protein [Streptococcaceae bacterium]